MRIYCKCGYCEAERMDVEPPGDDAARQEQERFVQTLNSTDAYDYGIFIGYRTGITAGREIGQKDGYKVSLWPAVLMAILGLLLLVIAYCLTPYVHNLNPPLIHHSHSTEQP